MCGGLIQFLRRTKKVLPQAAKETKMSKQTEKKAPVEQPRLVRVVAWVEIMGNRAETTFTVESPWACEGACPILQRRSDEAVASWVFKSQCKSGFTVEPVAADTYKAKEHEAFYP